MLDSISSKFTLPAIGWDLESGGGRGCGRPLYFCANEVLEITFESCPFPSRLTEVEPSGRKEQRNIL